MCISILPPDTLFKENVKIKVNLRRLFFISATSFISKELLIFVDGQCSIPLASSWPEKKKKIFEPSLWGSLGLSQAFEVVQAACISFPFFNLLGFWRMSVEYHNLSWSRYLENMIYCTKNKTVTTDHWLHHEWIKASLSSELELLSHFWILTLAMDQSKIVWSTHTSSSERLPSKALPWHRVTAAHRAASQVQSHCTATGRVCTPEVGTPR